MDVIRKYFVYLKILIKLGISFLMGVVLSLFNSNYKNVWIIAERGIDARDNGYHLFNYISKKHPYTNVYYIIDYNSPDYNKVRKIGKTANNGSLKHYILLAISKIKISTHILGFTPDSKKFSQIDKLGLIFGKKVFLQHGITKDDISFLYYPNVKLDLFICGAYSEYDFVKKRFGHPNHVVKYLGFCRFDNLNVKVQSKKQILLMPTWRTYIANCKNIEEFKKSQYYNVYQSLINNNKLIQLLIDYEYDLIFYPHIEIQKFIKSFTSDDNVVKIASLEQYDVQPLLIDSAILITDYSSVFFDFAYMKKPLLYYQFDENEYRSQHYQEGYFNYNVNGFGAVVKYESQLIDELELLLKRNTELQEGYRDRINTFFPLNDNHNCERNYNAIKNLVK